jgi:hypothetical protein
LNLEKASSAIKAAFICGIVSTLLTLSATLVGIFHGGVKFGNAEFSALMLIDVGLLAGLTVGLFFKSRTCALLMVGYFVWCKATQWSAEINYPGFIVGLLFLYFYVSGARGTFVYHRLRKEEANQAPEPTTTAVTPASQEPRQR